jgi:hypothetical protein
MDSGTAFTIIILAAMLLFLFAPQINHYLEKLNEKIRRMNDRRK